jgi:uncharacterized protein DUF4386
MNSSGTFGRTVGVLLLAHLIVGLTAPFILLQSVVTTSGFLETAAAHPTQIRVAVFLLFVGSATAIGIAIAAWPVIRQYSIAMALWLLALGVASFSLQAVDNGALLSMLSLSKQFASVDAANVQVYQSLAIVVGSARKWAHYSFLLVVGIWIFLLYCVLYRFKLVPRILALFGLIGSLLQIMGVTLRGLLGYAPETRLAIPLAPAYVALAVWLMIKGFDEGQRPASTV